MRTLPIRDPLAIKWMSRPLLDCLMAGLGVESGGSDEHAEMQVVAKIEQLAGAALPYWNRPPADLVQDWMELHVTGCPQQRSYDLMMKPVWAATALQGAAPLLGLSFGNPTPSEQFTAPYAHRQATQILDVLEGLPDGLMCRVAPWALSYGRSLHILIRSWTAEQRKALWDACARKAIDVEQTLDLHNGRDPMSMVLNPVGIKKEELALMQEWVRAWAVQAPVEARGRLCAMFGQSNVYAFYDPLDPLSSGPLLEDEKEIIAYTERALRVFDLVGAAHPSQLTVNAQRMRQRLQNLDQARRAMGIVGGVAACASCDARDGMDCPEHQGDESEVSG